MLLRDMLQAGATWLKGRTREVVMAATGHSDKPVWPPVEDRERLRRYERNENLFEGEHREVFVDSGEFRYSYDDSREYVCANYLGALTKLTTWRLFGEEAEFNAPDTELGTQEFIDHVYARNTFSHLNIQAALSASYRGDACYKVYYDAASRRIVVGTFSPALYYPETDPLDRSRVVAANIMQVLEGPRDRKYLWQERHELRDGMGYVLNRLFLCEDSDDELRVDFAADEKDLTTLEATAALPPEVATGIDALLVVHVANGLRSGEEIWGTSDYEELLAIQAEINNRVTRKCETLDKHADPAMWGPDLRDKQGNVRPSDNKYLPVPDDWTNGAPAGYITWDGQLVAVDNTIKSLIHDFAATARIDHAALIPPESGGPVSGRALRLSQTMTQDTVRAKQTVFGPALAQVMSLCTKLATSPNVQLAFKPTTGQIMPLEPEEITVVFSDGLPSDRLEDIEQEVAMVDAQIQSHVDAIRVLHGVGDEEAEAIWQRIQQEGGAGGGFGLTGLSTSGRFQALPATDSGGE